MLATTHHILIGSQPIGACGFRYYSSNRFRRPYGPMGFQHPNCTFLYIFVHVCTFLYILYILWALWPDGLPAPQLYIFVHFCTLLYICVHVCTLLYMALWPDGLPAPQFVYFVHFMYFARFCKGLWDGIVWRGGWGASGPMRRYILLVWF